MGGAVLEGPGQDLHRRHTGGVNQSLLGCLRVVSKSGMVQEIAPMTSLTRSDSSSAPLRVLFVCLGNICRSPAAEAAFLHLVAEAGRHREFVVDSAGTGAWHIGEPADAR